MFKDDAKSCNEFITQPEDTKYNEPGFIGNFAPRHIQIWRYKIRTIFTILYFLHISDDYNTLILHLMILLKNWHILE